MRTTTLIIAVGAAATTVVMAGCSGSTSGSTASSAATGPTGASAPTATGSATANASCPLTVTDAWVKAADSGMSAAFGVVRNPSGADVSIASASSPASAMTQLHQTTVSDGVAKMSEVNQLVVPADGELTLSPGGDHIMFMNLTAPVVAGQDVPITLTCAGGGVVDFTAQARSYSGANESYQPSGSAGM